MALASIFAPDRFRIIKREIFDPRVRRIRYATTKRTETAAAERFHQSRF